MNACAEGIEHFEMRGGILAVGEVRHYFVNCLLRKGRQYFEESAAHETLKISRREGLLCILMSL